jgi:HTH-type transcriptional regulator, sugar sensing transcriptional regulator
MLDNIFKQLGLKLEHSNVYLALLEGGIMPAGKLAKRLNVPRSTIYGLLDELAGSGLVLQNEKENVKLWQAVEPEKIKNIINDKINDLENTRSNFETIIDDLKNSQKVDFVSPKFTYFEGAEEMRIMLKDVLLYDDLGTELCWPVKDMMRVLGADYLNEFNKRRVRNNISIKVIWPQDRTGDVEENLFLAPGKEVKREVRLAPDGVDFSMGYWAYGNKVMFMSSKAENFGFIVESKEMRQLQKTQFETLWKICEPLKSNPRLSHKFMDEVVAPPQFK